MMLGAGKVLGLQGTGGSTSTIDDGLTACARPALRRARAG
jgi:hypothetical protein